MTEKIEDRYLGDGVYVGWTGDAIAIDVRAQFEPGVRTVEVGDGKERSVPAIYLEPSVMANLLDYWRYVQREERARFDNPPSVRKPGGGAV